jgi:TonB-linked SusC/RagA family outer membrane protein
MKKLRIGRFFITGCRKIFLVMRITLFLFLLSTALAFGANSYSQNAKISLAVDNKPLIEVFRAIEDQTEFIFFYQDQQIDLNARVSINIKEQNISDILDELFKNTGNTYIIRDRQIVIGKGQRRAGISELPAPEASGPVQQGHPVSGKVSDRSTGEPLIGVNILIEGTKTGTITDSDGNFKMNVPSGSSVLVFSYIGFITETIPVDSRSSIEIVMAPDFEKLQEVVVIGYGTQKKVNLSGAVDVVTSKSLESRPVKNVVQALQGLSPSLNITVSNDGGEAGGKMNMNIRGYGSISGTGGKPYILVDGIEQDIYNINPDDVENISVLKDAASSSIYGARAAFGVILITTKKGRKDGVSINYSNNFSFAKPTLVPHSVNSLDFAEYFNAASVNDGSQPLFQPVIIDNIKKYQAGEIDYWTIPVPWAPLYWLSYSGAWANTDWYKEHYKEWVPNSTHSLSLNGGNDRTQFYVSGSTLNQAGLLKIGDDSYTRNTLNAKINTKVYDWLRFNFSTKYFRKNINRPSYDKGEYYYNLARQWPTNAPYYPDGSLAYENVQIWLEQGGRYDENQNEFTIIPGVEIEPVKGWVFFSNYRWKMNTSGVTNHEAKVIGTLVDGSKSYLRPNNNFASYDYESYYNSPNIYSTYNKSLGDHNFTIMAGFEQELMQYRSTYAKRWDLVSDKVPSLTTATGKQESTGTLGHYATRSYFGRFNYSFKEKYLLEFSARYDGSSKFEKNYRWGAFPSASAAYVISKESFWNPWMNYVNMFKLRASYGSLGNQDVDNYLYVERLPIFTNLPYIMGDELPNYVGMANLVSPELTWEKVRTTNFGFDAGFMKNRLNLSFDYFVRNTFDMLGPAESLPSVLGTAVPKSNNASLKTKGFEFVLGWKDNVGDFSYDARILISDATSTITKYYNPQKLLSGAFYEGAQLGEIWGYTTTGLFKSNVEAQAADQSYLSNEIWRAGDVQYTDINKDGKIDKGRNTVDDHGDLSIIGNSTPRYAYSFYVSSSWKGFDFNMLWQGIGKRDLALDGTLFWGTAGGEWWSVGLKEHMDYWTEENTDAYWPRPYMDKCAKNHQVQSRYLQNGAYLRLKSLQLGYTLPAKFTQKALVKNLRIYFSGENLYTHTKLITIFDPEATGGQYGSGTMYPLQKILSLGINLTF